MGLFGFGRKKKEPEIPMPQKENNAGLKQIEPDLKLEVPGFPTLENIPESRTDVSMVKGAVERPVQPSPVYAARQPRPTQAHAEPWAEFSFDRPTAVWPTQQLGNKQRIPQKKPEIEEEPETEEVEEEVKEEKLERMEELEPIAKPKEEAPKEKKPEEIRFEYLKSGKPIYINFTQYADVLESLKDMKQTIQLVDTNIQKTTELKTTIETRSRRWRDMADEIQKTLREIDTKLFER